MQKLRRNSGNIRHTKAVLYSNVMSHLLCHLLLLVFLIGGNVVLVKSTEYECGEDICCKTMGKLMAAVSEINSKLNASVSEINSKLDRQGKDLEGLKVDMTKGLDSTGAIKTQLERHSADLSTHDGRLKAHDTTQTTEHQLVESIYGAELGPRDCSDVQSIGYNASGIYRVYPGSDDRRIEANVYCDFSRPGQSWLVFQRRKDGSVNFERLWKEYEQGFGDLNGEFWLGNEKLSLLTMNRKYKLRFELEDFNGEKRYAEYSTFSVRPGTDKYRLTVGEYSGNAGDSLTYHNGMMFTTRDADNDRFNFNCAQLYRGAWWHDACHYSNLNGLYLKGSHTSFADGINWRDWRGYYYSLKATEMMIAAVF